MATPRNPNSGRFTYVSPAGAADSTPPPMPLPGPTARDMAKPLPILDFSPALSISQTRGDCTAVSMSPRAAGPLPTMSTTPMQDFGQPMGQTLHGSPRLDPIPVTDV